MADGVLFLGYPDGGLATMYAAKDDTSYRQPKEIYVTGEADSHADHRATFWFARDAARTAEHRGPLWTFIVHGREPSQPPDGRLMLTDPELATKRRVLEGYQTGVSPIHDQLVATYTQPEERFWLSRPEASK